MARERSNPLSHVDLNFLGTIVVIAAIGCLLIYSATYFNDPGLPTIKKQLLWLAIGFALMFAFLVVDYHVYFDVAPILYGIGVIMLIYLLAFGKLTANVKSWIHVGGFQFQPSEFMKIFTALMLARFFNKHDRPYLDFKSFIQIALIIGIPVGLIIVEPDFGTAATFFPLIAVAMFFGGIRWKVWTAMILAVLVIGGTGYVFFLKPYQKDRIVTFMNPDRDPLGKGYQVTQAKIAIGSGGIHGKGFLKGTQAKLEYLPARHTDFIFAVLGEEWGFIGVTIVLALYLFLIVQAMTFAKHARDRGGSFLAISLISFFIFHVFINVAMQIGVLPTTGIPLPLISYGGSSAMMFLSAIGLILNVDARRFGSDD